MKHSIYCNNARNNKSCDCGVFAERIAQLEAAIRKHREVALRTLDIEENEVADEAFIHDRALWKEVEG